MHTLSAPLDPHAKVDKIAESALDDKSTALDDKELRQIINYSTARASMDSDV